MSIWQLFLRRFQRTAAAEPEVVGDFTAEYLRSRMFLADDGVTFIWKLHPGTANGNRAWDAQWAGKSVRLEILHSNPDAPPYPALRLNGRWYSVHRVMWLYHTGNWPTQEIDHEDNDTLNWRFDNLREATHGQNQMNKGAMKNNLLGVKGVGRKRKSGVPYGGYYAQVNHNGKVHHLGTFPTLEGAIGAYRKKAAELHGEFLHASQRQE